MAKYDLYRDKSLSHNYITYYWMNILCEDFNVSEGAKNLFALVFSFTKDGRHKFNATQKYIAEMIYCSPSSVKRYTKELADKGLVSKSYTVKNDNTRVEMSINEDVLLDYFGCGLQDLYRVSKDNSVFSLNSIIEPQSRVQANESKSETIQGSPERIIMDFTVSRKNGLLQSKENAKPRETKKHKENKYTKFVNYLKQSNYPDSVIACGERYIKWLLGNRKVDFEQWQIMIDTLNSELKQIPNKSLREEAAADAFNSAFAGGFRKLGVDKYKYGKNMTNKSQKDDTQVSDSKVEMVQQGVYRVVSAEPIDFVKDENGNIMTF